MARRDPQLAAVTSTRQEPDRRPSETARPESSKSELGAVARGGVLNLVGAGTSSVANFVLVVLVTRGFDKTTAGVFFTATSVFLLGARVAELGTTTGLVYFISRFRSLGTTQRIRGSLRIALLPVLVTSVVAAVIAIFLAPDMAGWLVHGDSGDFATFLRILVVFLPLGAASDALLSATQGIGTMRPMVAVEKVGRPVAQVVLTVLAVVLGSQLILPFAWVVPYLPAAVLAAVWLRKLLRRSGVRAQGPTTIEPGQISEFWRFTAPRALASVVQLALQRLDIVLVAAIKGPIDAAIYTAATRFLVVGQLGAQAITTSVQPRLSQRLARHEKDATNHLYRIATGWLILVTWPLYLMCAVFAPYMTRLFGHGYTAGTTVVVLLSLTMLIATACGMVDVVLIMGGRTTWNLGNAVLALVVNITVDILLIPHLGILGAGIGWSAAILVNNLLPLSQIAFVLGLHPFSRASFTAILITGACFGIVPGLVRLFGGTQLVPLLVASVIGTLLFLGALWLQRQPLALDALATLRPGRRGSPRHAATKGA